MPDVHSRLFGNEITLILGVPAYPFFVMLGIAAGIVYYFIDLKRSGRVSEGAVKIVVSASLCGMIGSKIPLIFEGGSWVEIIYGKSIVGALIGGMFGVIVIKKICGIKLKLGNLIAPAVALGMAIGRIGCFLSGCCYGKAAKWGFDFGDGLLRLPTQLFETGFHLIAFAVLVYEKKHVKTPGVLFKFYLLGYFIFRFFIEFIRENPVIWCGMTIYQIICVLGIIYFTIILSERMDKNGERTD